MTKLLSLFVLAGGISLTGIDSVSAATGNCPAAVPATARAAAPRAPATAAQPGTRSIRRYSAAPSATSRAPAMRSYRSNGPSGPSWTATRKVLGY